MLILIISSFSVSSDGPPLPIGIGGRITVDNVPVGGITVRVENVNTSESRTATTSYDTPHTICGFYAVSLSGSDGDVIKVTVTYGKTYSNTVIVNIKRVTQFCNVSIITGETPPDPPPGGNGETPEEPEEPPEEPDEPNGNETEEPEQNETENGNETTYYLTVKVVDNITGDPISSASVTVYCNESKIAKSYTNDTGAASFVLEEGDYTVEVAKEGYSGKSGSFTLLCSVEQPFSLDKKGDDNPNPQPTEGPGVPLYAYGIICAIVVIIMLCVIIYWRWYR